MFLGSLQCFICLYPGKGILHDVWYASLFYCNILLYMQLRNRNVYVHGMYLTLCIIYQYRIPVFYYVYILYTIWVLLRKGVPQFYVAHYGKCTYHMQICTFPVGFFCCTHITSYKRVIIYHVYYTPGIRTFCK